MGMGSGQDVKNGSRTTTIFQATAAVTTREMVPEWQVLHMLPDKQHNTVAVYNAGYGSSKMMEMETNLELNAELPLKKRSDFWNCKYIHPKPVMALES